VSDRATVVPLRILVLDDRVESRYVVSTWLRRSGFDVVEAANGAEALQAVDAHDFDLVVLDVNLPDMSGFEVCEHIRAHPRTASMGVIHLSATAIRPADRSEGLLRGADAFLAEPVEPSDLLATITALIRRVSVRQVLELTTDRLRALNRTTADVHAASNDTQLFDAVAAGLVTIAGPDSQIVLRRADRAGRSRWDGQARVDEPLDPTLVDRILDPAVAGHSTLSVERDVLGPNAYTGTSFVDESGEPTGALLVPSTPGGTNDETVPMLAQLAVTISLARANINALDIEHRTAVALQHNLLPHDPPALDGVRVHFHYDASSQFAEVGGDFYEAVAIDDRRIFFAIGDVVGHSLRAATIMGELRHAIRAYALEDFEPDTIVERVDRWIQRFHPTMYTTMLCGVVDLSTDQATICNAGHPPALFVRSTGETEFEHVHGAMAGFGAPPPPVVTVAFRAGDRLVLVTDGLIERPAEIIDRGLERLAAAALATRHVDAATAMLSIADEIGPSGTPIDDIAMVVIDRLPVAGASARR